MGVTWDLIKAQPAANIVGPLGKRAGLDIKENFNSVLRLHQLPGAGVWANIGQGNSETDSMPKTLDELTRRAQTVNYQRIDIDKMEIETYLAERAYHNSADTYIHLLVTMRDKTDEQEHSYIRPHGKYYDYLVEKGHPILNTEPNHYPKILIENETEAKQVSLYINLLSCNFLPPYSILKTNPIYSPFLPPPPPPPPPTYLLPPSDTVIPKIASAIKNQTHRHLLSHPRKFYFIFVLYKKVRAT